MDLHFEDINELNQLPPTSFVCTSVSSRKLDNYGRLTTENRHYYYLDPALAYERVQVKYLPNQLEIYYEEGTSLLTRSSVLAWKIPWTDEPGSLQSVGSQRVGHKSPSS